MEEERKGQSISLNTNVAVFPGGWSMDNCVNIVAALAGPKKKIIRDVDWLQGERLVKTESPLIKLDQGEAKDCKECTG